MCEPLSAYNVDPARRAQAVVQIIPAGSEGSSGRASSAASSRIAAMPYLIDGHNLIPKLGLRLDSPDDEMELIGMLQEFARLSRRKVEVYFDGAPPGQAGSRSFGTVRAHFVQAGLTADDAIQSHIRRLQGAARNWTVVSSDHQVQAAAKASRANVVASEDFAKYFRRLQNSQEARSREREITQEEVDRWLKLFERKD